MPATSSETPRDIELRQRQAASLLANGPTSRFSPLLADVLVALAVACLAIAGGWFGLGLSLDTFDVPVDPSGDGAFYMMLTEGISSNGTYLSNPMLGAPQTQDLRDLPHGSDNLNLGLIGASAVAFGTAAGVNVFVLATFAFCGVTAFVASRVLGVRRDLAAVVGVLYALLPYHFSRNTMHLLLSNYAMVPFAVMVAVLILGGRTPFVRRDDCGGVRLWKRFDLRSRQSLALAFLALGLASTGAYYALYSALLITALAGMRTLAVRKSAPLLAGVAFSAAIGIGLVANLSPTIVYWASNGTNSEAGARTPIEPELYGLKLTSMIFPTEDHRVPQLAALVDEYRDSSPVPSERGMALGVVGALGLFAAVGSLLVRALRDRTASMTVLERCGAVALTAFLLSTIAGLSVPLALLGLTSLRSWNRIVVFIAFASLVGLASLVSPALERVRPRIATIAALCLVAVVATFDQIPTTFADRSQAIEQWNADAAFYEQVATGVGEGLVLQLPYVPFPESAPVGGVGPYDHALAYVHQPDTRWSFGVTIGRGPVNAEAVSLSSPQDLAQAARSAGYVAIVIDRRGPQDTNAILAALEGQGGTARTIDGRLTVVFLDA